MDNTNPIHYHRIGSKKQPIQSMYELFSKDEFRGFIIGNVIKYITRFNQKNGVEDLEKAKTYIQFLINTEQERDPLDDGK